MISMIFYKPNVFLKRMTINNNIYLENTKLEINKYKQKLTTYFKINYILFVISNYSQILNDQHNKHSQT